MREPIPSTNLLKDIPDFAGFPIEGSKFLAKLALNNDKVWFDRHREEYDAYLLGPLRAFVMAVGAKLRPKVPRLVADPRVGGSVTRIARDIRFSADKSPYKTWVAARWWDAAGGGKDTVVGFYFHIDSETAYAGGGIYQFDDDQLVRYRRALSDPKTLRALRAILGRLSAFEIGGESLKRTPRGFSPDHPAGNLLLHKGFYSGRDLKLSQVRTTRIVDDVVKVYLQLVPLTEWLTKHVVQDRR